MIKNLKTLFFKISDFTSKLGRLIPKKRNRIVIYSNWGFRDNIRTLYQYLVDNGFQDKYEIVCASNNFYHLKLKYDFVQYTLYIPDFQVFL